MFIIELAVDVGAVAQIQRVINFGLTSPEKAVGLNKGTLGYELVHGDDLTQRRLIHDRPDGVREQRGSVFYFIEVVEDGDLQETITHNAEQAHTVQMDRSVIEQLPNDKSCHKTLPPCRA